MPPSRRSTDELLEARRRRADELKAQIARLENRKKTEDRRRDVRRKIIVGAAVLAHAEADASFRESLQAALRKSVTRESDLAAIADLVGESAE